MPVFSSLVIETLKDVDPTRKCFRLVGGVLVERTVKEVLPALESNKEQVRLKHLHTELPVATHTHCGLRLHYITFMHLADAFIQSDFQERALQKSICH